MLTRGIHVCFATVLLLTLAARGDEVFEATVAPEEVLSLVVESYGEDAGGEPEGGACGGLAEAPCCDCCDCAVPCFCGLCNCECDPGLVITAGFCYPPVSCGGNGELCCSPGCTCDNQWLQQYFGVCGPCGGNGQAYCISGTACQPGLVNNVGICSTPLPCGANGELCCEPNCSCDNQWLQQYFGFCGPCGGEGDPFCINGTACQPGMVNLAGICTSCPGVDPCLCNACGSTCDPQCNPLCGAFDLGVCVAGQLASCPPPAEPTVTTVYVTPAGSVAPNGTSTAPYGLVESAVCKAAAGQTVSAQAGAYRETFTVNKAVTLTATGGLVRIGGVEGSALTTLRVLTYNTHLFGAEFEIPMPPPFDPVSVLAFADFSRAWWLGVAIKDENADVVGLTEVWDVNLAATIIAQSQYAYSYYVDDFDEGSDILNSGLLLLSKYPLSEQNLTYYDDAFADDMLASKGFMRATITKNGFQFGIFVSHMQATQSYAAAGSFAAREGQLIQLGDAIDSYAASHPAAEVLLMGDLNVVGGSCEYFDNLVSLVARNDAHLAAPCFAPTEYTFEPGANQLIDIFCLSSDCSGDPDERLDYILFSHGGAHRMLPVAADVRKYQSPLPLHDGGESASDLSDHYGLLVAFDVFD